MTIQTETVQVNGEQRKLYRFNLQDSEQKALYEHAKQQGLAKAPYTHAADPGGQQRPLIVIEARQILGTTADAFTAQILREQLPEEIEVVRYDDIRTDNFERNDLFDIQLKRGDTEKIVEVRSSIALFLPTPARVIPQFRLLGWYSTANKSGEEKRDYYFQPVFILRDRTLATDANARTFPSKSSHYFEQGYIDLYMLGCATRKDLEDNGKETSEKELLQTDAVYQTLKLNQTRTADDLISIIKKDFGY
ncbi:hypothetical protein Deipr_1655 [Deinococcus proteolyticus MRP]|uniref:Uncharacterized protein n=1 Tax=Deinococcus proteolyticus (strain ATCC 35074 / DSM 20540 / JCM 6276 / NBRC 101906 / NCIMB 13154 / VKM Ac-1939 / CCM 2703 / MRP) TaxID=693977 RepID=F0RKS7_DEIPM|nr:hypothetical protein [Deinococcus proteolyticus]ADY26789.1 hypothetical protein Deipr_1655 [Deinococcus proteolyticus MRP]